MLKIFPLFSGSSGNSLYVEFEYKNYNSALLVDIGVSTRRIENAMLKYGLNPKNIRYVFITHEHNDHMKGLDTFIKKYKCKVFSSKGTHEILLKKLKFKDKTNLNIINSEGLHIKGAFVKPFTVSHDCECIGYTLIFKKDNKKISVCSDLGFCSDEVLSSLKESDIVFLESNHDISMLKNSSYHYSVKSRILSNKGHLSNDECNKAILELAKTGTKHFVLTHLSSENNTVDIAYNQAKKTLENLLGNDFTLNIAPKENLDGFFLNI